MSSNNILQFESVSKSFLSSDKTITILDKLNFQLGLGESCAIVGPSGSGKTTFLTLAAGLDRASSGEVFLLNQKLSELSEDQLAKERGRNIGFIFQNFQLVPSLNVIENVLLPLEIRGLKGDSEAENLIERVGLKDRIKHYPQQLSGGEQQRVAIARAFINKPKILFADEPTGSLDLESAEIAIEAMFDLNKTSNCSILLVTHDHNLADRLPRKISLKAGKIISDVSL